MEDGGQGDAVLSGNLQQVRRKARTGNLSLQSSKVIFIQCSGSGIRCLFDP